MAHEIHLDNHGLQRYPKRRSHGGFGDLRKYLPLLAEELTTA